MNKVYFLAFCVAIALIVLLFNLPITKTVEHVENFDTKIQMAVEKVNGDNPMEGIMMLKEIVEKDSENTLALFYLGVFSMQSGQFEKSILRFQKILSIDSSFVVAHRYLGESLLAMGDTLGALKELKEYIFLENVDTKGKNEITILVNKLNKNL